MFIFKCSFVIIFLVSIRGTFIENNSNIDKGNKNEIVYNEKYKESQFNKRGSTTSTDSFSVKKETLISWGLDIESETDENDVTQGESTKSQDIIPQYLKEFYNNSVLSKDNPQVSNNDRNNQSVQVTKALADENEIDMNNDSETSKTCDFELFYQRENIKPKDQKSQMPKANRIKRSNSKLDLLTHSFKFLDFVVFISVVFAI